MPLSKQSTIAINKKGASFAHVKSMSKHGKANQELIKLVSKQLKLRPSNISIVAGLTKTLKRVPITGAL